MPKFDGRGPLGYGPATGRGIGSCQYGRGCGRRYYSRKEEAETLKEDIKDIENELEATKERLSEIEGQK